MAKTTKKSTSMRPVWEDMSNPIVKAVAPLKNDAMDRAKREANKLVARVTEELAKHGNDAEAVAPYPSSRLHLSRVQHTEAMAKYRLFRAFVKHREGSRRMFDPEFVDIDAERVAKFIEQARRDAGLQYDSFVAKLVGKIGEVKDAKLSGNHVWGHSLLKVTTATGEVQVWKTQQIVNQSKLGTLFNQWPTRKLKNG